MHIKQRKLFSATHYPNYANVISKFYYLILYTVELVFYLTWDYVVSDFCMTCSYDRKMIEKI